MVAITFLITVFCFVVNAQNNIKHNSTIAYDPAELLSKIFNGNSTQARTGYGLIKFQDQFATDSVSFEDQNPPPINVKKFRFEKNEETNPHNAYPYSNGGDMIVKFENHDILNNGEDNSIGDGFNSGVQPIDTQKKKRRRRKPRKQFPNQAAHLNPGYQGPVRPGFVPAQGFGPNPFQPGFNNPLYRPPRGPRPSLASDALSAVTEALTSIAQNDDYQCVARLLCEAAAGGALGGSSLLDSVSGLQPLLTLLSAYNGISSNPLFVFGRAAFLGMSSKSNPGSCRYAYSLCPTDPEQLVHYLNNHNGGFFRFFKAPQHGQQNLQQFYNQLSQNYGLYQPNPSANQEHYGLLNPGQFPGYGLQQTNLYPNGYGYQQNYHANNGIRYKYDKEISKNADRIAFDEENRKIQKRIQNKPAPIFNDNYNEHSSKWLFPGDDDYDNDESNVDVKYINYDDFKINDKRHGKTLKFPESTSHYHYNAQENSRQPENVYNDYHENTNRKQKGITFPETQSNYNNNYNPSSYYSAYPVYNNDNNIIFNNVKRGVSYNHNNQDEPGVTTVYVVRGNGDPNKPEIVKLRPGQKL